MNTGFSMALATSIFIMFYIKERMTKAKLLQIVSGVNKLIFWLIAFIMDYAIFFLVSMLYILVLAAYQKDGFSTFDELFKNYILILLFGFAVLPFTYVLSFAFRVPTTGLVTTAITYIVTGTLFYTVYFVLISELLDLRWVGDPLGWTFLIFPHYSLTRGMSNLNIMQTTISTCDRQCAAIPMCTTEIMCETKFNCSIPQFEFICNLQRDCCDRNFFNLSETGIGVMLIALIIVGLTAFVFLFIIEFRVVQTIVFWFYKPKM